MKTQSRIHVRSPRIRGLAVVASAGLMALWLALVQKMQRLEVEPLPAALQFTIAGIFTTAALIAFVALVARKQVTWPLLLLLLSWAWFFFRDLANGDVVLGIILGGAIVIGSFYASTITKSHLAVAHLTFPVGFLAAGLIVTLVNPEGAVHEDGWSDLLGTFPFGQYMGFAGHPNHLGPVMALGILIILSQRKVTVWGGLLVGLFFAGLIASGSDGSIVALAIALVFVALFHDMTHRKNGHIYWKTIIAGVAAGAVVIWSGVLVARTGVNYFTTGRNTIWSNYVDLALSAGLFGYGHFPDRDGNPVFNDITRTFIDAHSIWLAAQVTGGYIGSVLHLVFWIAVIAAIWKLPHSPERILAVGLTVFLLVYGSVETLLSTGFRVYYPAFGLLVALLIPPHLRERETLRPKIKLTK